MQHTRYRHHSATGHMGANLADGLRCIGVEEGLALAAQLPNLLHRLDRACSCNPALLSTEHCKSQMCKTADKANAT